MKSRLWTIALLVALASCFHCRATAAQPKDDVTESAPLKTVLAQMNLSDGDSMVFLGDSITHQCLYTQYVEDYFYTRFPKRHIHFHNAGVGGDRAADALVRLDDDVIAYKPKYVTILLGMNDGSYRDFDKDVFDTYQRDMTTLLDRLAASGTTVIAMTPTMFDSRAKLLRDQAAEPRDTYYNGVLALYGAWLEEAVQKRGLGFVDMYSPLNQVTIAQRKTDAEFTCIPDGVHPAAPGQVVMAAAVIRDVCPHRRVSAITIQDENGRLAAAARGGKISDFEAGDDGVRFTFTAEALPWVLPPAAAAGYEMIHAGRRYSLETLSATNLKPGAYELKIDGQSVGTWSDTELASRVELQANEKTPQYQQALNVAMLNQERNDKAVHPLRNLWSKVKVGRRQIAQLTRRDPAQAEAKQKEFDQWLADEFKPGVAELQKQAGEYERQIYEANQPVARHYELIRAD